jgi:hypothetical protein
VGLEPTPSSEDRILSPAPKPRRPLKNKPETSNKQPLAPFRIRDDCKTDPDLAEIINVWAELPEAIQQAMLTMARATVKRGDGE